MDHLSPAPLLLTASLKLIHLSLTQMIGTKMPKLGCSPGASSPCEVVEGVSPLDTSPKGVRQKHSVVSPADGIGDPVNCEKEKFIWAKVTQS